MSDNCCMAQERRIQFTEADIGKFQSLLEHACKCGNCCRRVAVWAEIPSGIVETDEWLLKAIARVSFGCQRWCNGAIVEVDVKRGVILDLMGDYINVDIGAIEIRHSLEGEVVPEIVFGAMSACCGAGAARGCATRTTERIVLGAAEDSGLIPIPPFAYAVQFADTDANFFTSDTSLAQVGSGLAGPLAAGVAGSTGDVVPDPWMIVNGAQNLFVFSTSGTQFEAVFLIGV